MTKKLLRKLKNDNENGARKGLLEELFNDFHRSRVQVYWMNFFRGIFFGVGTVVGGTLVVALVLWLLSLLTDIPGGFGDFVDYIVELVRNSSNR